MKSNVYYVEAPDSEATAISGVVRDAQQYGVGGETLKRLETLAGSLLDVARGLDEVTQSALWLVGDHTGMVLRLRMETSIDTEDEDQLKELATDGKNTERETFWGKVKGVFQELFIGQNEANETIGYYNPTLFGTEDFAVVYPIQPFPQKQDTWDDTAAECVQKLADHVEIGYTSARVEIAAKIDTAG